MPRQRTSPIRVVVESEDPTIPALISSLVEIGHAVYVGIRTGNARATIAAIVPPAVTATLYVLRYIHAKGRVREDSGDQGKGRR